jgi:hypothetical protein
MFKKSFTLVELIIVTSLIFIIYFLTLSNLNFQQDKADKITLINLKQTLASFSFEEKINLRCFDDEKIDCLFLVDDIIQDEKIVGLFEKCPEVYEYSRNQIRLDFVPPICFEFELRKDGHSSQMIVELDDKVLIYDNISLKPKILKSMSEIADFFDNKIDEVRDAF